MGLGSAWGTREELLHPRDKRGRFRTKWGMAERVVDALMKLLDAFNPRTFGSQGQASSYVLNEANRKGRTRFQDYPLLGDFFDANDALRTGKMSPTTQRFVATMDRNKAPLPEDLILTTSMGPDAFGLTPETVHLEEGGIEDFTGKLIADRGYLSTNIGTPSGRRPGDITLSIATPKGTQAIIPGRGANDSEVILDRDQELRVTKVDPDGSGGYYVYAVATPRTPGETPEPIGGPSTGRSVEQREAGIAQRSQLAERRTGAVSDEEIARQERDRAARQAEQGEPGVPPQDEDEATRASRRQQILGRPAPAEGPVAVREGAPRTEESPALAPPAPVEPAQIDFRTAVREAGIPSPSSGKRRAQWNAAYLGVAGGKKHPVDALRELEADIAHNERLLEEDKRTDTDSGPLVDDIKAQRALADLIREKYNLGDGERKIPLAAKPASPSKGLHLFRLMRESKIPVPDNDETEYSRVIDVAQGKIRGGSSLSEVADWLDNQAVDFDASVGNDEEVNQARTYRGRQGIAAVAKALRSEEAKQKAPAAPAAAVEPIRRTAAGLPKVEPGVKAPTPRPRPSKTAPKPTPEKTDLDTTVPGLRTIAKREGVDLKGVTRKADIQEAIRTHRANPNAPRVAPPTKRVTPPRPPKTDLDGTLPELRTTAKREGVNLKGVTRKADIQAAIRAHRDKTRTPQEPGVARVQGPRVSEELVEPGRQGSFVTAWNQGEIPERDDSIGRQNGEIFRDVRDGKITPAEAVRRLENEIDLNQQELDEIGTDLTSPNLSREEFGELNRRRLQMQTGIAAQRKALQVLTDHFRLEPREPDKAPGRKDDPLRAEFVARLSDGRLKGAPPGRYSSQIDEAMLMVEDGRATRTQAADWLDNRVAVNRDQLEFQRRRLANPIFRAEERHRIQQQIDEIEAGAVAQEKVVAFLREPPAPETLTARQLGVNLPEDQLKAIKESTPASLREAARINGIDVPEDLTTKQQILNHITRELARAELERRQGRTVPDAPVKKTAPRKAARSNLSRIYRRADLTNETDRRRLKTALDRATTAELTEFADELELGKAARDTREDMIESISFEIFGTHVPEGRSGTRLDARQIAEGLDFTDEMDQSVLDDVQRGLNGEDYLAQKNLTPAAVGRGLEQLAKGPGGPFHQAILTQQIHLESAQRRGDQGDIKRYELELDEHRARGERWLKLAERLKATRRPGTLQRRPTGPATTLQRPGAVSRARLSVRPTLARAHEPEALTKAATAEYKRITGRDIKIDLGPPDTQISMSTAKDHLEGVMRMAERFPDSALRRVTWFDHPGDPGWAYSGSDGTLEFNVRVISLDNRGRYLRQLAASVAGWETEDGVGFHPRGANTPISTAAHEMGHMVDYRIGNTDHHDDIIRLILRRARERGLSPNDLVQQELGSYAINDIYEMIGEAFSDVGVNGPQARALSQEIYDIVSRAYDRRKK